MGEFEGVAEIYEASRRGYPIELQTHLVDIEALAPSCLVVDLGAGTGQLARLAAEVANQVVAVEPETDMLKIGEQVTAELSNVRWVCARDAELRQHFNAGELDLVTIGNAFHHMDQGQLLQDLDFLISAGGLVCIATSSVPVWLQDSDWSRALRSVLETELGPLDGSGVPNTDVTVAALTGSAFSDVSIWSITKPGTRTCESVLGEVMSSASGLLGPTAPQRVTTAIERYADQGELPEDVRTTAVIARRHDRSVAAQSTGA